MARYQELAARHGEEAAEQIAWASQAVPVTVLQRHALRVEEAAFEARVRAELGEDVTFARGAAHLPAGAHVVDAPLFAEGLAYVQDPTAHAAAELVGARPGERVLDLCAAPGGKSIVLALDMQDQGKSWPVIRRKRGWRT